MSSSYPLSLNNRIYCKQNIQQQQNNRANTSLLSILESKEPENCTCRKPQPKLGLELIKKYRIDPSRSYMIGDKKADVEFGHALGFKSVLVTTANGKNHLKKYPNLKPEKVASNLLNAARFIAKDSGAAYEA